MQLCLGYSKNFLDSSATTKRQIKIPFEMTAQIISLPQQFQEIASFQFQLNISK